MPQWIISFLYGALARFIGGFMAKLKEARADDPGVVAEATRLMREANARFTDSDEKRAFVIGGMKIYSMKFGWEIGTSAVDALIVAVLGEWASKKA